MLVTVAVALIELRFEDEWGAGALFALAALAALVVFGLGVQARPEGGRPPAFQSVLLVAGLVLIAMALLRLAEALGAEDTGSAGTLTWVLAAFGALALWPGVKRGSAICVFIAAVAFGAALLAAWQWLFEPDTTTPFRWLLVLLATVYVLVSLALRGSRHRHSELLVSAAGLAILVIALLNAAGLFIPFGDDADLPAFWELVLLVSGCGLLAYAAADRVAGPAYLGVLNLALFTALTAGPDATVRWWPLVLLVLGLVAMGAGLRPRRPLPSAPAAYGAADLPLAARTAGEQETVIRVRDDT